MSNWEDKTVYGDKEKPGLTAPRLFEMMAPPPVGQVTVFSGRAKNQSKDHWYLNCAALAMHSLELQASTADEAKERAFDLVLNVCDAELERWRAVMAFLMNGIGVQNVRFYIDERVDGFYVLAELPDGRSKVHCIAGSVHQAIAYKGDLEREYRRGGIYKDFKPAPAPAPVPMPSEGEAIKP